MIPLIDVSLVLLVFFMMTAGAVAVAAGYHLPEAEHNLTSGNENMIWIGLRAVEADPTSPPSYSIGEGEKGPAEQGRRGADREAGPRPPRRHPEGPRGGVGEARAAARAT